MQASGPDAGSPSLDLTELGRQLWAALVHAADELNMEFAELSVVNVEHRVWPDASLGIPEPGAAYVQMLTSGLVVTIQAGGRTVTVHTGPGPTARSRALSTEREFDEDSPAVASAMLNLATMTGLRFSDVELVGVQTEASASETDRSILTVTLAAGNRRYVWTGPASGPLELQAAPEGQPDG